MAERFGIGYRCAITFEPMEGATEEVLGTAAPLVIEPVRKELGAMATRAEAWETTTPSATRCSPCCER